MTQRYFFFVVIQTLLLSGSLAIASSNPKKAVYETSGAQGFKISPVGLKNLGVKVEPIGALDDLVVPYRALVFLNDKVGVYRLRDEWFKLISIDFKKRGKDAVVIQSKDLKVGDSIVVEGAALMRVAESDAFGGEDTSP